MKNYEELFKKHENEISHTEGSALMSQGPKAHHLQV